MMQQILRPFFRR